VGEVDRAVERVDVPAPPAVGRVLAGVGPALLADDAVLREARPQFAHDISFAAPVVFGHGIDGAGLEIDAEVGQPGAFAQDRARAAGDLLGRPKRVYEGGHDGVIVAAARSNSRK